jgi:transposase
VAAYCGLTSSPYNSGAMIRDQGISRAGNRRARSTAVELAWLWLRYQPESRLARWFHERVGEARGRFKRIMIVALARKLMVTSWTMLRKARWVWC